MNSISRRQGCSLTGVLLLCTCDLPTVRLVGYNLRMAFARTCRAAQ